MRPNRASRGESIVAIRRADLAFGLLLFLRSLFHGLFLRGLLRHNFLGDLFDLLHDLFGGLFGNMNRFGNDPIYAKATEGAEATILSAMERVLLGRLAGGIG